MARVLRWALASALVAIVGVAPFVYFRWQYDYAKRLREVVPGRVYRSGQLTADGLADAVARYGVRTVLNVQDEFPDPDLYQHFWTTRTVKEKAFCEQLGVRYVHLKPELISRRLVPEHRPPAIDEFLAVMDDPASYPVLIHCHAGLHRTGVLVAVYRMEYQGYSPEEAWEDMRANGFGPWVGTASNDYVTQYVLSYRRGLRPAGSAGTSPFSGQEP
jgi:tyrosine-protein phosphatase SIW14